MGKNAGICQKRQTPQKRGKNGSFNKQHLDKHCSIQKE